MAQRIRVSAICHLAFIRDLNANRGFLSALFPPAEVHGNRTHLPRVCRPAQRF
jgi:hypothetical protein